MHATVSSPAPATRSTVRVLVWDLPVRVFHWGLVATFSGAYLLSETERLRNIHVNLGYVMLGLVALRLVWGLVGSRHARFADFRYRPAEALAYLRGLVTGTAPRFLGHNPAGSYAVWAILGLAILTGASGYATYNEFGGELVEELHEFFANAWLGVVGLHIAGVVIGSLAHRENLPAAMVSGYKRAGTE
jgi:cytochrome b